MEQEVAKKAATFQELVERLQNYWAKQGCAIIQPLDIEVGAATPPRIFFTSYRP